MRFDVPSGAESQLRQHSHGSAFEHGTPIQMSSFHQEQQGTGDEFDPSADESLEVSSHLLRSLQIRQSFVATVGWFVDRNQVRLQSLAGDVLGGPLMAGIPPRAGEVWAADVTNTLDASFYVEVLQLRASAT